MWTLTRIFIAGLLVCGAAQLTADPTQADQISLDTPIKTIELDAQGNVTRIEFGTGDQLANEELEPPEDIETLEVHGMRRLPFHILKDADSGQIEVVVPCDSTTSVLIPPEAGASTCIQDVAACPFGCRVVGGRCVCSQELDAFRFPALVEVGESEFKALRWPPE